ncbi:MAG: T9SS type A sorting domain-containing protein [Bacteroidota bacterium]
MGDGIGFYQGTLENAAGNTFSFNSDPDGSDFNNASSDLGGFPVNYWYSTALNQNPENTIGLFKKQGELNNCNEEDDELTDATYNENEILFNQKRLAYYELLKAYELKIDDNRSEDIQSRISQAEHWFVRLMLLNDLEEIAPYVSKETLMMLIDAPSISKEKVMNVAMSNPDLLKSSALISYMEQTRNLGQTKVQQLAQAGAYSSTLRTEDEMDISIAFGEMQAIGRRLLAYESFNDHDATDWLAIQNQLAQMGDLGSMYQQAELLFQIREESKANLFLNTEISDEIAGVEQLIEDHEDYITVTDLTQSVRDTDRDWSELVLEFEGWDILKTLAATKKNIAASQAKHLLNFYLGERYVEIPQLVANSDIQSYSPSGSAAFGNIEVATDNNHTWMAYPNPANNEVNFNYDFSEIQDQVRLQVFNLSGKVIFEQDLIDNSGSINWKVPAYINGVLFYSFSSNDFFSETRKLILLR